MAAILSQPQRVNHGRSDTKHISCSAIHLFPPQHVLVFVPLTKFELNFKFDSDYQTLVYILFPISLITMIFCTYQDSCPVLVCAKFHYDHISFLQIIVMTLPMKLNLIYISLVGWTPGPTIWHQTHRWLRYPLSAIWLPPTWTPHANLSANLCTCETLAFFHPNLSSFDRSCLAAFTDDRTWTSQ